MRTSGKPMFVSGVKVPGRFAAATRAKALNFRIDVFPRV
jgi:hypothetical protein